MAKPILSPIERLESKFIPEPNSGCWLWTGWLFATGYGGFDYEGRTCLAHRASWLLHRGDIPDGIQVLHRCDNPCCVNPEHLFLGTPADNMQDKIGKGRHSRRHGERNAMATLTDEVVRNIRAAVGTQRAVAARFGVSGAAVWAIRNRKRWSHVA
jgi:hypothetical protein